MRSSRILLAVGLASFLQSVIWADQVQLVGDAYFNPGGSGVSGALATINVGGAANFRSASGRDYGSPGFKRQLAIVCKHDPASRGRGYLRGERRLERSHRN